MGNNIGASDMNPVHLFLYLSRDPEIEIGPAEYGCLHFQCFNKFARINAVAVFSHFKVKMCFFKRFKQC